ncbi:TIR domain-containing adapter molecule 1 [Menidia menidia]
MIHDESDNRGTGLRDVFDVLEKVPSERLLSLSLQLGDTPEDCIVQALCLFILRRGAHALNKLQMLGDNSLAKHLAEKWRASGGKLEGFGLDCGDFRAQSGESLSVLARIFKVLSEKRLCDPLLRNLAYKRALSCDGLKTDNTDNLEYHQFREEAKVACGPAEWLFSNSDFKLESSPDPNRSLEDGDGTLRVSATQDRLSNSPCPLQESTSEPSYPSHLEISVPPTVSFRRDEASPETLQNPKPDHSIPTPGQAEQASWQPQQPELQLCSTGSPRSGPETGSGAEETLESTTSRLKSCFTLDQIPAELNNPSIEPRSARPSAASILLPKMPVSEGMRESQVDEEEEDERFYAFVILHAPEDAEVAESMREKLESVICCEGATFSEDFALFGKSTLRCVEDAINNSAFTFLLLTRNFNTKMLEMKTNIALINSINNRHKFNTVIPLLPRENCMPPQRVPLVLQTLVPLEEKRSFERKLQKSLSPAKIERQRRIWTQEQALRKKMREKAKLGFCAEQNLLLSSGSSLGQDAGDRGWWPPQHNIHIENAKYIMIGNDSKMTVDLGGGASKDGSGCAEEEQ